MTVVEQLFEEIRTWTSINDALRMQLEADIQIWLQKEQEQLNKANVSSRLSLEELIWKKQNPDKPFNADDFYDWAAENAKVALDFAFDIHHELVR